MHHPDKRSPIGFRTEEDTLVTHTHTHARAHKRTHTLCSARARSLLLFLSRMGNKRSSTEPNVVAAREEILHKAPAVSAFPLSYYNAIFAKTFSDCASAAATSLRDVRTS
jgi:hypothetical protein